MHNFSSKKRRLRVLTWHIHGSYLYYLTNSNADFFLPVGGLRKAMAEKQATIIGVKMLLRFLSMKLKILKLT